MFCSKDREVVPKLCRMPSTSTRAWKVKGASAVLKVQANRLGQKWLEPYMIYIIYIYILGPLCGYRLSTRRRDEFPPEGGLSQGTHDHHAPSFVHSFVCAGISPIREPIAAQSPDLVRKRSPLLCVWFMVAPGSLPPSNHPPKTNSVKTNTLPKTSRPPKKNSEDEFHEDEFPPKDEFRPRIPLYNFQSKRDRSNQMLPQKVQKYARKSKVQKERTTAKAAAATLTSRSRGTRSSEKVSE